MKVYLLTAAVLAAVVISGCTQMAVIGKSSGLQMTEFIIDPQTVNSARPFDVFITVENTGEAEARNVKVALMGLPDSMEAISTPTISPKRLYSKTEERTGGFSVYKWSLKAPNIYEGTFQNFPIRAGVSYDYTTEAVFNIPLYSEDESLRMNKIGENPESAHKSVTDGPFVIDTYAAPVVIRSNSGYEDIVYNIKITNAGSGIVIDAQDKSRGTISGKIEVSGIYAAIQCSGQASTSSLNINLRDGRSALLPCKVSVPRALFAKSPMATMSLKIYLKYRYYFESEKELKVSGTRISEQAGSSSKPSPLVSVAPV
jgi:hypothetical protein